jgi:hypothetical protein
MRLASLALVLAACSPAPEPAPPPAPSASASAAAPASPHDICLVAMKKSRSCGDLFLPALMDARVKNDRPKGIAARFKAEGREKMLSIAREEFKTDYSDESIARHCKELSEKPADVQERVIAGDRSCLAKTDCTEFVACDIGALDARWKANP